MIRPGVTLALWLAFTVLVIINDMIGDTWIACQIEGDAADAFDLVGVVDLGVDRALLAVAEIADLLGLAEIDAAGEFAHDDDVEPLDHLRLQRRGAGERGITHCRANVGVERQVLAQPEQPRLGARLIGHVGPFRAADRRRAAPRRRLARAPCRAR